jgi:hypothetical protein
MRTTFASVIAALSCLTAALAVAQPQTLAASGTINTP